MNIELLNVRIYIQKNEVISDAIRNRKNAWKDYYTCYATVSAEAGKESTDAGLVVDDSKIDFTIRYCKRATALTSTGYRVQFESELYDILAVDHMNFKRKCIKLSCQKVRR
jgi:SPP1 family predicted phage head-tail adaptor|nr:MAG TPA: Putative head tail adaptor [Caudoviricetes sp.]